MGHRFPERLREVRTERRILQRDLERALNLQPGVVSQYERGRREPAFAMLLAFAEFFEISADYLLGRPEAPVDSPAVVHARRRLAESLRGRRPVGLAHLLEQAARCAPEVFAPDRLSRRLKIPQAALPAGVLTLEQQDEVLAYLGVNRETLRPVPEGLSPSRPRSRRRLDRERLPVL